MKSKVCTRCNREKETSMFRARSELKSGLQSWCKKCESDGNKKRYVPRPKKVAQPKTKEQILKLKECARDRMIAHRYGINPEQYKQAYVDQKGMCAICFVSLPLGGRKGLYLDHCHLTKKFRGLLCPNCNAGIGKLKDSIEIMESAINYLKSQS